MTNLEKPKRVLFLALSGIGNYLMQSSTITGLKKVHPDWHITVWVVPRGTKALAEHDSHVDEVIEVPIKNTILGHWQMISHLRQRKFDIGIVLSPGQLLKSALYLWLAGIPKRIGGAFPHNFMLTDAIPEDPNLHDVEQNLRLLRPLGIQSRVTSYELRVPPVDLRTDGTIVGIHAGAAPGFEFKRWPVVNFSAVAKELIAKHNAHILIFGGPDEKELKESLRGQIGIGATVIDANLIKTAGIIKDCTVFLSNDSGLMHLAAAVGVPTFGLFGPTDEKHTGPRGPESYVIRAPGTKPVYNTEKNFNPGQEPHSTLLAITPQLALDNIVRALPQ